MFGQFSPGAQRRTIATAFPQPPINMIGKPKRIAHNTYRYTTTGGSVVTRLHTTDIHILRPDGAQVINSGGFRTSTTKERLNRYTKGYAIYSGKGSWIVRDLATGETLPFLDNMVLPDAFNSEVFKAKAIADDKAAAQLKKKISKFLKLVDKGVPEPSNGDCWCCLMFEAGDPSKGDSEHLLNHIDESYLHGSLIINALLWAGYDKTKLGYVYTHKDIVKRALRRYLKRRLGLT
jgi:hypothetical protein